MQQFDRGLGNSRIELVDVAGNEQRHGLARSIRRIVLPRRDTLGGSNHGSRPARFSVTTYGSKNGTTLGTVMLFEAGQNPHSTDGAGRWLEVRRMPGEVRIMAIHSMFSWRACPPRRSVLITPSACTLEIPRRPQENRSRRSSLPTRMRSRRC